jgi:hypothetical protein
MIQNNKILDKLIKNNASTVSTIAQEHTQSGLNSVPTGADDEVLITTSRVVGVRYKVYTVILLLLLFVV